MLCAGIGITGIFYYSSHSLPEYSVIGFGFVFLLASYYNIKNCFKEVPSKSDEDILSKKAMIPVLLVLLWVFIFIFSIYLRLF